MRSGSFHLPSLFVLRSNIGYRCFTFMKGAFWRSEAIMNLRGGGLVGYTDIFVEYSNWSVCKCHRRGIQEDGANDR